MKGPRLIIICGVPGSGKSTFALHVADRFGAVRFASETFAEQLGAAARTATGDLSKEAIRHAYDTMASAVKESLATGKLVAAVGSFRSEEQRRRFRNIATACGAKVTTVRLVCSIATAAQRVSDRRATGERGPNANAIRQIDAELGRASDIDAALMNESSLDEFHKQIDNLIGALE
jgi:predicted kinase